MDAGRLNRRVTILRRTDVQDADYGTQEAVWTALASVWAEVQDILPSRSEGAENGIDIARRPARVRMRYRDDVNTTMRLQYGSRVMRIISGPAEIGFREGIEIVVEELTTGGQEP